MSAALLLQVMEEEKLSRTLLRLSVHSGNGEKQDDKSALIQHAMEGKNITEPKWRSGDFFTKPEFKARRVVKQGVLTHPHSRFPCSRQGYRRPCLLRLFDDSSMF